MPMVAGAKNKIKKTIGAATRSTAKLIAKPIKSAKSIVNTTLDGATNTAETIGKNITPITGVLASVAIGAIGFFAYRSIKQNNAMLQRSHDINNQTANTVNMALFGAQNALFPAQSPVPMPMPQFLPPITAPPSSYMSSSGPSFSDRATSAMTSATPLIAQGLANKGIKDRIDTLIQQKEIEFNKASDIEKKASIKENLIEEITNIIVQHQENDAAASPLQFGKLNLDAFTQKVNKKLTDPQLDAIETIGLTDTDSRKEFFTLIDKKVATDYHNVLSELHKKVPNSPSISRAIAAWPSNETSELMKIIKPLMRDGMNTGGLTSSQISMLDEIFEESTEDKSEDTLSLIKEAARNNISENFFQNKKSDPYEKEANRATLQKINGIKDDAKGVTFKTNEPIYHGVPRWATNAMPESTKSNIPEEVPKYDEISLIGVKPSETDSNQFDGLIRLKRQGTIKMYNLADTNAAFTTPDGLSARGDLIGMAKLAQESKTGRGTLYGGQEASLGFVANTLWNSTVSPLTPDKYNDQLKNYITKGKDVDDFLSSAPP